MTGIGPVMKEIREAYRVTQTRHTGAGRYLLKHTSVIPAQAGIFLKQQWCLWEITASAVMTGSGTVMTGIGVVMTERGALMTMRGGLFITP